VVTKDLEFSVYRSHKICYNRPMIENKQNDRWAKERAYCEELGFLPSSENPNLYIHIKPELNDVRIEFCGWFWKFYSCGVLVYSSTEDNLSYVLECNSATTLYCPACGKECAAQYYHTSNLTNLWNCDSDDLTHHFVVEGDLTKF